MTRGELDIETGLYDEIAALDAQIREAEGRALVYRELSQEAVQLLAQARDHALRQGRTIQHLRGQIAQLLGAPTPAPPEEETWL